MITFLSTAYGKAGALLFLAVLAILVSVNVRDARETFWADKPGKDRKK